MKKFFMLLIAGFCITATVNAQDATKQMSKEEKAKLKERQDKDMMTAFTEAGLSEDQIKQVKQVMEEARVKSNAVKKDNNLSEEEKESKLKEISTEKNAKIKEIMGKDAYKKYNDAKKRLKEEGGY